VLDRVKGNSHQGFLAWWQSDYLFYCISVNKFNPYRHRIFAHRVKNS